MEYHFNNVNIVINIMINSSNLFYFETKNRSTPVRRARAKNTSIYIKCAHILLHIP